MATWKKEVKNCKVSKQDAINELIREMKMRDRVYTNWIRQSKLTRAQAVKRCAALKLAYSILKEINDKEVGKQKELFT